MAHEKDGDGGRAEQNASNMFILGSNWWPWGEVKKSNIFKFWFSCQFHFYTKSCVCSHKQKMVNILNIIFILLPGVMPEGRDAGARGFKTLSVGICDAPHRLRLLVIFATPYSLSTRLLYLLY